MREHERDWEQTTWEGSRREQLRRWLAMSVRERLEAMAALSEQGERLAAAGQRARDSDRTRRGHAMQVQERDAAYQQGKEVHRVALPGCSPIPLASYLKALGVLRLVAEQADAEARGYWRDDHFVLESRLDAEVLRRFLLEEYRPTPVLAPWNGGSGFFPKDNQSGIAAIEHGSAERFSAMRATIATSRSMLQRLALSAKPDGEQEKKQLLAALRAEVSEEALVWLDAAVLLTEESPKYPPLLGTGGNDGRLDFTNNFMQRLVSVIDPDSGESLSSAGALLDEAIYDESQPGVPTDKIGQFAPGDAGGPNQTSGFEADALVNPWDFILMLEGALLFAAAATRRLESTVPGMLSYPFTVKPTGAGSGATALGDEDNARAETWVPLWSAPAGIDELKGLLAEGRVTLGRRPVRDGLDFARAVSRLGVERGISAFQRYAFLMRSGKAFFATPLSRVLATRNPAVDLIDELDSNGWLSRFRSLPRRESSNRVAVLVHRLEDVIFGLAQAARDDPAPEIQKLLSLIGEAQLYLARSPKARDICPPVPWLTAQWLIKADDGSPELALAAALAGLHARKPDGDDNDGGRIMPMRAHLAPERTGHHPTWNEHAVHQVTWGQGAVEGNLIATLQRRLLEANQRSLEDKPLFPSRMASVAHVAAWLAGELDGERLAALLPGLMLVRIPGGGHVGMERDVPLPAAYRLLKPFFCTDAQLRRSGLLPVDRHLAIPADVVRRLAAGSTDGVLEVALRRLRAAGVRLGFQVPAPGITDGRRLLAALPVPISDGELRRLFPGQLQNDNRQAS